MSSPRRKVNVEWVGDNEVRLSGATALISDDIKELGRKHGVKYVWDEDNKYWQVTGDRDAVNNFISELQARNKDRIEFIVSFLKVEKPVAVVQQQAPPQVQVQPQPQPPAARSLLETLTDAGFDLRTVGVIYGQYMAGKTTLMTYLASELVRSGLVKDAYLFLTESNVIQGSNPLIERIRKLVPNTEYVEPSIVKVRKAIARVTANCTECFIGLDGLGSIILHTMNELVASEGIGTSGETLPISSRVIPLINSLVEWVSTLVVNSKSTMLITAHEQQTIMRTWFGENAKPSFSSRGLHSTSYVWRILVRDDGTRVIKVIANRLKPETVGKTIELPRLVL